MKKFEIYALVHPVTRETRYIGKTTNKKKRFRQHINDSLVNRYDYPVNRWIRKLDCDGLQPEMIPIERHVSLDDMNRSEKYNIAILKEIGVRLLNICPGGEGGMTPETSKKINDNLGPEGRSLRAKKVAESLGPEGCKIRAARAHAALSSEQRSQRAVKGNNTRGEEGRHPRSENS